MSTTSRARTRLSYPGEKLSLANDLGRSFNLLKNRLTKTQTQFRGHFFATHEFHTQSQYSSNLKRIIAHILSVCTDLLTRDSSLPLKTILASFSKQRSTTGLRPSLRCNNPPTINTHAYLSRTDYHFPQRCRPSSSPSCPSAHSSNPVSSSLTPSPSSVKTVSSPASAGRALPTSKPRRNHLAVREVGSVAELEGVRM